MIEEELMDDSPEDNLDDGGNEEEFSTSPSQDIRKLPELPADLAHKWLTWQCKLVSGIICGAIFVPDESGLQSSPLTVYPKQHPAGKALYAAAQKVFDVQNDIVKAKVPYGPGNKRLCDLIACPLLMDNQLVGVVALIVSTRSESQRNTVLTLLKWGGLWMKTLVNQRLVAQNETGIFSMTLGTIVLKESSSQVAAMNMANLLSDYFECERVSIGFRKGLPIRLQAFSHIASFDPRSQLVRRIESAMEEAVDQLSPIVLPKNRKRDSVVSLAHDEMITNEGCGSICTVPLPGRSGSVGAITMERGADQPFDENELELAESLAGFIGPVLEIKQQDERPHLLKATDDLKGIADGIFGEAYMKLKIIGISFAAILILAALIKGDHEVTADASVEGLVRQILVAPQNGYVKESKAKAGDLVKKDQLIAMLDDRKLQLERKKWQSEYNKIEKEYQEALAKHDRIQVGIQSAKKNQISAELLLVDEQISQTRFISPFDGVLVSGDLSQSLGAPVEKGDVLFEVAPLDSYRVMLEIEDREMAGLREGKTGKLIIAALPYKTFDVTINQVIPIAVSREQKNFFRVEATLSEQSENLLPGMRGVAKIVVDRKSLLWIWTHSLTERIRLWFWSL